MKYIKKDESGIVVAASEILFDDTYELADEEYEIGFDGKIYSVMQMQSADYLAQKYAHEQEMNLALLRFRREEECFRIINRGQLWYANLKEEQKSELAAWYQAWLDAPQTGVVPTKPSWIK